MVFRTAGLRGCTRLGHVSRSLTTLALVVGSVILVGCAPFGDDELAVLTIDPACLNPTLVLEDEKWTTDNMVPEAWRGLESVEGHVTFKFGQKAEFVGDDGLRLKYTDRHDLADFTDLTCLIGD